MTNGLLLVINTLACSLVVLRLIAYRRQGSTHRPLAALFAYILIVANGSVAIRIVIGDYIAADWSETLINIALCIAILITGGNVTGLMRGDNNK